jgi:Protein of unknown function (DUF3102)
MISNRQGSQPMKQLQTFDYAALDAEIQIAIQHHTSEIKTLIRRTAQDVIDIGHKLTLVKEHLKHGEFRAWLQAEFSWSISTAARFMRVATRFKRANLVNSDISASALYLLAESSTPNVAQEEALELSRQGENVTYSVAKDIVRKHKTEGMNNSSETEIITISVEAEEIEAEETHIASVSENIAPRKSLEISVDPQGNNHNIQSNLLNKKSDFAPQKKLEGIHSLLKVGSQLCITDVNQQVDGCVGRVAEVNELNDNGLELLIKVVLQPINSEKIEAKAL